MNKYFVYITLFALAVLLWMCVVFYLTGDAAGFIGFVAFVVTIALIVYAYQESNNK